jgi:hypothetical protein
MGSLDFEVLATSRLPPSKRHAVVRLGQWARSYGNSRVNILHVILHHG